jgi:hypothetical protein
MFAWNIIDLDCGGHVFRNPFAALSIPWRSLRYLLDVFELEEITEK